ncbi:MAG: glycosyltransferase family 2 protein [Desulfohalobiaceae bacterium]|nr:glycosyltransferase family 2 protein [Desulfohalobiaceae bacterium]
MEQNRNPHTPDLRGGLDGLQGAYLTGWACRKSAPEEHLWLEIRVDNIPLGVCRAEHLHVQAQKEGLGDSCYGFWLRLPEAVFTSGARISLHVANSREQVGRALLLDGLPDLNKAMGRVYSDGGLRLSGWLRDPDDDNAVLEARCVLEGKEIARSKADMRRFDPPEANGHGFSMTLPFSLADGISRMIELVDKQGRHIPGSPCEILTVPQGPSAWLRQLRKPGPEQVKLLESLLNRYENWFPKSAGLDMYEQWRQAFPLPSPPRHRQERVGVILLPGPGLEQSRVSLQKQKQVQPMIWCPDSGLIQGKEVLSGPDKNPAELFRLLSSHCEYLVLAEPGCSLEKLALAHLLQAARETNAGLVYADGVLQSEGGRLEVRFKPAWDPDFFLGHDYLDGPLLWSSGLLPEFGQRAEHFFKEVFNRESGQTLDSLLYQEFRFNLIQTAAGSPGGIKHLPLPLYKREASGNQWWSVLMSGRRQAVQDWFDRFEPGLQAQTNADQPEILRIHRPLRRKPLVSLIIPTRDRLDLLEPCVESLLELTTYRPYELLIVDNASSEPESLAYFEELKQRDVRVLPYPQPFNYAAINNLAVDKARGEIVCLLNNDLQLITPHWLEEMLALLLRDGVGAVGAKLLWPNNLVQHGGVVTGVHQLAAHVGNDWLAEEPGYMYRNCVSGRWSAVTAACLLTRRDDYLECGGLDAVNFPVTFNDVDYCLKLAQQGKGVVWTPQARFYHYESASRGKDDTAVKQAQSRREMQRLRGKWGETLLNDPFYNPNFSLSTWVGVFDGLALPPGKRSAR